MRAFLDRVYDASLFLAGCFLVGIASLMVGEALVRKAGGYITGASELIGWFCAAAGFLALPATFKRGDMVRVGALVDALQPAARRIVLLLNLAIAVVFTGYMIRAVAAYLIDGWQAEELTQGMILIPVWVPQLSFLVGVVLLMVAVIDEVVVHLRSPPDRMYASRSGGPTDSAGL